MDFPEYQGPLLVLIVVRFVPFSDNVRLKNSSSDANELQWKASDGKERRYQQLTRKELHHSQS